MKIYRQEMGILSKGRPQWKSSLFSPKREVQMKDKYENQIQFLGKTLWKLMEKNKLKNYYSNNCLLGLDGIEYAINIIWLV